MKARLPFDERKIARVFAWVTYVFSLLLAFLAGSLADTHAAGAAPFVLFPGLGLAVLSPFIWFGARWTMVLAFLIGAGLELMAALENPTEWWLFLVIPVVLGMLTLMHAIARASDSQSTSPASVINRFHAGLVYAYSFVAAVAAPIFHTWQLGAPIMSIYALVLSVALGAMSWFIWRGATWAMIVVWALVTMQWLVLASLDPSFWVKIAYVAPPIMFALLTIVSIVAAKMRAT